MVKLKIMKLPKKIKGKKIKNHKIASNLKHQNIIIKWIYSILQSVFLH